MALMTSMRNRMHIVLWGLLVMFLLSMTLGGLVGGANIIEQLFGRIDPTTILARINDVDVSPDYYKRLVNQQLEQTRSRGQKISDFQIHQARNTAWDKMVQDILVSQEVERLGLFATDEEVLFHLENNPPPFLQDEPSFQTDGSFDREKYLVALANPQDNEWAPIESFMKNTYIPNYKLQQLLNESIVITEENVESEFIKRNVNYTVSFIHVSSAKVAQVESDPTDGDLMAEYNNTRTDYKHDELRTVTYVSWKKIPSQNDSVSTKNKATELFNRTKSGEDFAALANKYSMDPGNQGIKGGDLGWFNKGQMVKPFEIAAFSANKGEIVGPVKSNFGYHIIQVRDKKTEDGEKMVQASHILLKVEISETTLSNLSRAATLFSYDAQSNGFASAIDTNKNETTTHEKLNQSEYSIDGLGGFRAGVFFAFNRKDGDVSDVLENDNYFAVFTLDEIIPPGISPYEDIEGQLKGILKKEKVMEATLDEANKLLINISSEGQLLNEFIDSNEDLDAIKDETKTLVQGFTSIGRSNYVTGALLASEPGNEILGPLETGRGHALVQVHAIAPFDSTEYETQKETLRNTIFNRKQNQYFQSWLENLKSKAEIVDNRKYHP